MILPRLLDSNFNEVARLRPSSLTVSLTLTPISTASMVLSEPQDVEPEMRQYVEIYGGGGESLGIFRIVQISTAYGTSKTVSLEHAITTLEDSVTGADLTFDGTMQSVLSAVLDYQTVKHWQLGQVDDTKDDYSIAVSYSNCLQVLQEAARQADGCYLAFDQSSHPWTVSLLRKPDTVASECRISRNIEDVSISLDDSALCTRVYSEYLADGYLDADTVGTWGVIAQAIQLDEDDTAEKNLEVAQKYLDECKNPAVSINIGAIQLSELTGEPLDSFTVGSLCRVALPDWGIAVDERVISLTYSDLVLDPQRVRLVLSSAQDNTAKTLNSIVQKTRQITRVVKEQHKHITETDTELKLHADKITAQAKEIELKASNADVSELGSRVTSAEIDIDGVKGEIALKASKTEVDELTGEVTELETTFTVSADGVRSAIQDGDKTIAELNSTVNGLEHWVTDADGNISTLTNTVRGMESKVEDVNGRVSLLTNTADGLTKTITEQGYELSGFRVKADEISSRVADIHGNVGSLVVKSDSVTAKVASIDGQVGQLSVRSDEIRASISSQGEEMAALKVRIDEISATVKGTDGNVGKLIVTANSVASRMEDTTGKLKALTETTDEHFISLQGDITEVDGKVTAIEGSSIWQTRDSITAAVGTMYVDKDGNLHIKDGSGLQIDRGSASLGVYDAGNLTAGVLVKKLNDGTTTTKIKADVINLEGYVTAEELEVKYMTAEVINTNYITAKEINAEYATINRVESVETDVSNLTAGLTTALVLNANMINGSQVNGTYGHFDVITHNGDLVSQRNITMGDVGTVGKALSVGGELNLQHSHKVTVNDDGTITLGEVSTDGGNFRIADTKVYKDAVSAAASKVYFSGCSLSSGVLTVNLSNDKSQYYYSSASVSVDDKSATVTLADNRDMTGGVALRTVDVSSVYNGGWNDALDACTKVTRYTISETPTFTLYMQVDGHYTSAGDGWVKVTRNDAYKLPDKK